jgi:hypothetical protein
MVREDVVIIVVAAQFDGEHLAVAADHGVI